MLKIFRRVGVLRKYFNTKILQHSVCNSVIGFRAARALRRGKLEQGEETYEESNCCGKDFRKVFEATTYI